MHGGHDARHLGKPRGQRRQRVHLWIVGMDDVVALASEQAHVVAERTKICEWIQSP